MGNCGGRIVRPSGGKPESQESTLPQNGDEADLPFTPEDIDDEVLERLLREMKDYHKERLRLELEEDPQQFVLDNLLMCIQFFDNFEKAKEEANQFKWDTERELTELLAKDPLEGTILGDRRVKLLTGMSHVLAQNYIYKGKSDGDEDEEVDIYYGGLGLKDTFMAEGILPLDFTMVWDNLELYDKKDYEHIREYSDAKGASPIARFYMEQPDKKTRQEFPKGYVRLRCIDEPIPYRKKLDTPPNHPIQIPGPSSSSRTADFVYDQVDNVTGVYSKPDSDEGIPEAHSEESESDGAHNSNPTTDEDDDDVCNLPNFLNNLPPSPNKPSTSRQSRPILPKLKINPNLPGNMQPSVVLHAATPPVSESSFPQPQTQLQPFNTLGLLHPPTHRGRIYDTPQPHNSRSPRDTPSSGYDTTSTISKGSSVRSSQVRDKWQKLNLKRLWEFGKKSRKDMIVPNGKYDPLPPTCYSEVKYEKFSYDSIEEEDEEDDEYVEGEEEESEDSSTDSDSEFSLYGSGTEKKKEKKEKDTEDEYETRFYLNSLQVSSSACSEFHYIGPKLNIPPSSMQSGVVLGTTIRCPMPYTFQKDKGEDEDVALEHYYVTHTFTPALHSKSWPDPLYNNFNLKVGPMSPHYDPSGENWPSRLHLEQIESSGCNVIPIGFRPMDFFNAEQILEWELNFHDSEIHLLNSFRHPHWRAYIFSAIIFRAFLAPLGPQGIGLPHFRNILYFMCHQNFTDWEDEQPGLHLRTLFEHLNDSLSKNNMSSFFIRSRNLFNGIPPANLGFVHGNLSKIKENIIVYCIYAFRNLLPVRGPEESLPMPNFKRLFEILTVPEPELLKIININLRMLNDQTDQQRREEARQRARTKRKRQQQKNQLITQQDEIDRDFFSSQREIMSQSAPKRDKTQERLKRQHEKYLKKLEKDRKRQREEEKQKKDPEKMIPQSERRNSIDTKKSMPDRFSPLRLLTMIQFFIKHFLRMAEKTLKLQNYSQTTMYVLQVENLCEIITDPRYKYRDGPSPFEEDELDRYREQTLRLRAILDKDMHQYILVRLNMLQSPSSLNQSQYALEIPGSAKIGSENNWDLRKLPTPPPSEKDVPNQKPKAEKKILEMPNIASSFQSFDKLPKGQRKKLPSISIPPSTEEEAEQNESKLPTEKTRVVRRQESIKFVSSVIPKETPPSTPPRSARALKSRMSVQLDTELEESTDL